MALVPRFVTGGSVHLLYHFDGERWSVESLGGPRFASGVLGGWTGPPGDVWIVADLSWTRSDEVLHWDGSRWDTFLTDDPYVRWPTGGFFGTSSSDLFLFGDYRLRHYDTEWQPVSIPGLFWVIGVWADQRSIWLVGAPAADQILHGNR
jgi:hypothetical protein